jgi:hypothetical protein
MLTWPAFGYALLVLALRAFAPDGGASHTSASIVKVLGFAGVMLVMAPAVTYAARLSAGPKESTALDELAARVKLEA